MQAVFRTRRISIVCIEFIGTVGVSQQLASLQINLFCVGSWLGKWNIRAIIKATALLEREVKERTPFGVTGLLRQSIAAQKPYRSGVDNMIGVVSSPLDYVVCVELGTKPQR